MSTHVAAQDLGREERHFSILSSNHGKRAAEIWYFGFFLFTLPIQTIVLNHLSYAHPNDLLLDTEGVLMAIGAWGGATLFRTKEDRGRPFHEAYGFKFGCFLFVWAVIGGYLATDPWYTVLHGHFAFNTSFNPNGVPFFMLPETIAVFGAYATVLGVLFRVIWQGYKALKVSVLPDWLVKAIILLPLAIIMPLIETLYYTGANYCFDGAVGKWFLNVMIYGSWHYAGLIFYTSFDETPSVRHPWLGYVIRGFATVGILIFMTQMITDWVAPYYTTVERGVRHINDWSPENCLGPKPLN